MEEERGGVALDELRPEPDDLSIESLGFVLRCRTHAKHMAAPTFMVRRSMTVCAWRPSALSSAKVAGMSRNVRMVLSMVACCSPKTKGLAVSLDAEMSTKAVK